MTLAEYMSNQLIVSHASNSLRLLPCQIWIARATPGVLQSNGKPGEPNSASLRSAPRLCVVPGVSSACGHANYNTSVIGYPSSMRAGKGDQVLMQLKEGQ